MSRECFSTVLARLSEAFQDVIYCSGATTSKVHNFSYGEIVIVSPVYDALMKLVSVADHIRTMDDNRSIFVYGLPADVHPLQVHHLRPMHSRN